MPTDSLCLNRKRTSSHCLCLSKISQVCYDPYNLQLCKWQVSSYSRYNNLYSFYVYVSQSSHVEDMLFINSYNIATLLFLIQRKKNCMQKLLQTKFYSNSCKFHTRVDPIIIISILQNVCEY